MVRDTTPRLNSAATGIIMQLSSHTAFVCVSLCVCFLSLFLCVPSRGGGDILFRSLHCFISLLQRRQAERERDARLDFTAGGIFARRRKTEYAKMLLEMRF